MESPKKKVTFGNLVSALVSGTTVFLLTYFLIAVPAQRTSDRTLSEARERSTVEAVKNDVYADIEIVVRRRGSLSGPTRLLTREAKRLYQQGDTIIDSGGRYSNALRSYNAALVKVRQAIAIDGLTFNAVGSG